MPLEITLRTAQTLTITTTPQMILPARSSPDNRVYLSLWNKDATNKVMCAYDLEYNAAGFSTATGGWPIAPGSESWEQPFAMPSNAIWAWTLAGTALLNIREG